MTSALDEQLSALRDYHLVCHYLSWFYKNAYFGPCHRQVMKLLNKRYRLQTGLEVPEGYAVED